MLFLAGTSETLRVSTDAATCSIAVHATWFDLSSGVATPSRTNTATITSATTTTIVGSPSSSTYRNIEAVTIRNKGTTNCRIAVIHNNGTAVEKFGCILFPDEECHYEDGVGWYVTEMKTGYLTSQEDRSVSSTPTVGVLYCRALTADVDASSATANLARTVADLSVPLLSATTFWFRFVVAYTSSATTNGARFMTQGLFTVGSTGKLYQKSEYSLTTTSSTVNEGTSSGDIPAAANATSAATGSNMATIEGFIVVPSGHEQSTWSLRFSSELASTNTITVKAGSRVEYMRLV